MIIVAFVGFVIQIIVGSKGNGWREGKLLQRELKFIEEIPSNSPNDAIAQFYQKNKIDPEHLSDQEINQERKPWNSEKMADIVDALENGESYDTEWAKSELIYYADNGVDEAKKLIKKFKL